MTLSLAEESQLILLWSIFQVPPVFLDEFWSSCTLQIFNGIHVRTLFRPVNNVHLSFLSKLNCFVFDMMLSLVTAQTLNDEFILCIVQPLVLP